MFETYVIEDGILRRIQGRIQGNVAPKQECAKWTAKIRRFLRDEGFMLVYYSKSRDGTEEYAYQRYSAVVIIRGCILRTNEDPRALGLSAVLKLQPQT